MIPTHIVIHHSLTEDGDTVSWGEIRRYHMEELGWINVGYHIGIERVGSSYEAILGRPLDHVGSHCKELRMNHRSLGVCLVGNYDSGPPTLEALVKVEEVVRWLMRSYQIPAVNVLGHREVGWLAGYDWRQGEYKSCPGSHWDMASFRKGLQNYG